MTSFYRRFLRSIYRRAHALWSTKPICICGGEGYASSHKNKKKPPDIRVALLVSIILKWFLFHDQSQCSHAVAGGGLKKVHSRLQIIGIEFKALG